jgi:hypothetical protein
MLRMLSAGPCSGPLLLQQVGAWLNTLLTSAGPVLSLLLSLTLCPAGGPQHVLAARPAAERPGIH